MGKTADKTVYKTTGWCGFGSGSNAAAVDIKDGRIARIRPMDLEKEYDRDELNPWEITVRGKTLTCGTKTSLPPLAIAYKNRVYSKNRIPYPMKRVDWDPKGNRNTQNRGISGYERISWDEATQIIADEINRCIDTYGNSSVFVQGDGHGETKVMHGGHGCNTHLMNLMGGFTLQARQPDSWEGWYWGAKHMWGMDPVGQQALQSNVLMDISENADTVLFVGCDPETTPWGWGAQMASQISYFWHDIDIKQIYICPDVNYGAAVHADKWIPVLPNTDAALWLAVAYVWLTEGTYDAEYLKTHADGFDWFARYVHGGEDGIPKTPKWAESKCGVASRQIKAFARYWAKHIVSTAHCNGGGYIRSVFATEPARLEVALLAMQGVGAPGKNMFKMMEWGLYGMESLNPIPHGEWGTFMWAGFIGHVAGTDLGGQFIPQTLVPDAITLPEGEKLSWYGHVVAGLPREDQFNRFEYPKDGCSRIHMIWSDTPCWSTCWNGGHRMQDALRDESIEFYLAEQPWMENDTLFADIVLPISTKFEEDDILTSSQCGINDLVVNEEAAIDPLGEAKSDAEAALAIAEKLGIADELMEHWVYPPMAAAQNTDSAGNDEDFVNEMEMSTEHVFGEPGFDSLKLRAYTLGGCQQHLPYDEFLKKGYLPIRFKDNWRDDPIGMRAFYEDPENNPIATPTGKIEFYSTGIHAVWPDDPERPEVPHWIEESPRHHERLTNDRCKDYPFLVVSNHPRFRVHAEGDDAIWLREISMCKVTGPDGYKYEPVWINPDDARERGIKNGDIVRIYNERGSVLGGAVVTPRIIRHAISQDHGARVDSITTGTGGMDRGGANNLICPGATTSQNAPGEVTNGFLANIEKVDVFELARKHPEAFSREYDEESGLVATARVVKGE
jgi:anaerobic selenocysteine-containing dehydrogenase